MSEGVVLHLGDPDSHSGEAARRLAPQLTARPVPNFEALRAAFDAGEASHAVIPLHNSEIGPIAETAAWRESTYKEVHCLALPIRHALCGTGSIKEIEQVLSHPAALAQCRAAIARQDFKAVPVASTSHAARLVRAANDPRLAAICSARAARNNGLSIIEAQFADAPRNETVFALFERAPCTAPLPDA